MNVYDGHKCKEIKRAGDFLQSRVHGVKESRIQPISKKSITFVHTKLPQLYIPFLSLFLTLSVLLSFTIHSLFVVSSYFLFPLRFLLSTLLTSLSYLPVQFLSILTLWLLYPNRPLSSFWNFVSIAIWLYLHSLRCRVVNPTTNPL